MTTKITLAGLEIEVHELPFRQNKAWRDRATVPLSIQRDIMNGAATGDAEKMPDLYKQFVGLVGDHADDIFALVLERVPETQRAECEEKATQTEVLAAFLVLVREAFSTGFFWDFVGAAMMNGAAQQATGKNLPVPNGEPTPTS